MGKITQLQADFKADKITQSEYSAKLQALLDAGDIEQAEYDGAKGFEVKKDESKTFTQAELDAKIADRLARERKKYEGFDETKAELDRLKAEEDARKKAALTETERLQAERDEATTKATAADERATKAQEAANKRVINAEIRSVARVENAIDAGDVLSFIDGTNIAIDDDGNVTGVDEAVKALKETKPYLFKAPSTGADASGGSNAQRQHDPNAGSDKKLAELADTARRTGRTEDKVAYVTYKREVESKKK